MGGWFSQIGRSGLPRRADAMLAAGLVLFALGDLFLLHVSEGFEGHRLAAAPFVAVVPAVLVARRTQPLAAALTASTALALQVLLVTPATSVAAIVTLLILGFSLGAHASLGPALAGGAACIAAVIAVAVGGDDSGGAAGILSIPIFLAMPWLAGRAVRAARGYAERMRALSEALDRERERNSRLAVLQERSRIARELHDVVAHGVGVMTVQAAGARRIVESDSDRAADALGAIESTGRSALVELQRMLDLLQATEETDSDIGAASSLTELTALGERLRASGVDIELVVSEQLTTTAPALELAVFRVVQEALTNAIKHAPGASIRASVRQEQNALEIEVVDSGIWGDRQPLAGPGGNGIIGCVSGSASFTGRSAPAPTPAAAFACALGSR